MLRLLREAGEPLSVAAVADRMQLHENTARFHLDALVATELATRGVAARRTPGRPAAAYQATPPDSAERHRGYPLLSRILASSWARWVPDAQDAAVRSGQEWGRFLTDRLAPYERLTPDEAIARLMALLGNLGFAPELDDGRHPERGPDAPDDAAAPAERRPAAGRILLHDCPFRGTAADDPEVVCAVHLGLMRGALAQLEADVKVSRLDSFVEPRLCIASLS